MAVFLNSISRHCQVFCVNSLLDIPEDQIVRQGVRRLHAPLFFAQTRSLFPKTWSALQHNIVLLVISLCVLGAASQKAAAHGAGPVLTSASSASSTSVTLSWTESDPNPGWYRVLYGTSSGHYTASADFGDVTGTITGLISGTTYYFAVLFYESPHSTPYGQSNEISCQVGDASLTPTSRTWGSMDEWFSMSGASVRTPLTSEVLAAGSLPSISSWTLVDQQSVVSSTPDFTVAPSVGTMGGSITVNGVTYPDGTATQSLALNNSVNYTYLTTYSIPGGQQQVVVNGFVTFGWADLGFSGGYMDLIVLQDSSVQGGYVVLQLNNGNDGGHCYCVHIETVGVSGFMGRSAEIEIVPLHRYSFSLLFDEINGLAKLAIFDPSNNFTQVGSTVTQPQNTGTNLIGFRFGNLEAGTSSGTTAYFEDLMLDWTNHIFPNAPD